jgi:hypothetical protein
MKTTQLSSTRRLITIGSILTTALMLLTLTHKARAQGGVKRYSVSVPSQGNVNSTYEIMRIGRDSANWSSDMPYEVTVYTSYFLNGSMTKWLLTYGYTDSGTATPLQAYGAQMLRVYLGSEVVVSGTIKYRPVLVDLPNYMAMRVEVKYDTADVGSISGSGQVQFTSTIAGGSGTTYSGDIWLSPNGGNVGIATTSPTQPLQVEAATAIAYLKSTAGTSRSFLTAQNGSGSFYAGIDNSAGNGILNGSIAYAGVVGTASNTPLILGANNNAYVTIATSGNVGIGTVPTSGSSYKLDVNGNTNVTGNLNITANGAGTGNIVAAGTINAKYQDVAEWVPSSEQLSVGTVVVLDSTKSNQVTSSTTSYDTRVAGVVSEQPGIALGEKGESKVLVATTGRVRVKVDASMGAIHIGDLLVTSDIPGVAMKSEPIEFAGRKFHMPGTLIGKALEPLDKGTGTILVLLSLQ